MSVAGIGRLVEGDAEDERRGCGGVRRSEGFGAMGEDALRGLNEELDSFCPEGVLGVVRLAKYA